MQDCWQSSWASSSSATLPPQSLPGSHTGSPVWASNRPSEEPIEQAEDFSKQHLEHSHHHDYHHQLHGTRKGAFLMASGSARPWEDRLPPPIIQVPASSVRERYGVLGSQLSEEHPGLSARSGRSGISATSGSISRFRPASPPSLHHYLGDCTTSCTMGWAFPSVSQWVGQASSAALYTWKSVPRGDCSLGLQLLMDREYWVFRAVFAAWAGCWWRLSFRLCRRGVARARWRSLLAFFSAWQSILQRSDASPVGLVPPWQNASSSSLCSSVQSLHADYNKPGDSRSSQCDAYVNAQVPPEDGRLPAGPLFPPRQDGKKSRGIQWPGARTRAGSGSSASERSGSSISEVAATWRIRDAEAQTRRAEQRAKASEAAITSFKRQLQDQERRMEEVLAAHKKKEARADLENSRLRDLLDEYTKVEGALREFNAGLQDDCERSRCEEKQASELLRKQWRKTAKLVEAITSRRCDEQLESVVESAQASLLGHESEEVAGLAVQGAIMPAGYTAVLGDDLDRDALRMSSLLEELAAKEQAMAEATSMQEQRLSLLESEMNDQVSALGHQLEEQFIAKSALEESSSRLVSASQMEASELRQRLEALEARCAHRQQEHAEEQELQMQRLVARQEAAQETEEELAEQSRLIDQLQGEVASNDTLVASLRASLRREVKHARNRMADGVARGSDAWLRFSRLQAGFHQWKQLWEAQRAQKNEARSCELLQESLSEVEASKLQFEEAAQETIAAERERSAGKARLWKERTAELLGRRAEAASAELWTRWCLSVWQSDAEDAKRQRLQLTSAQAQASRALDAAASWNEEQRRRCEKLEALAVTTRPKASAIRRPKHEELAESSPGAEGQELESEEQEQLEMETENSALQLIVRQLPGSTSPSPQPWHEDGTSRSRSPSSLPTVSPSSRAGQAAEECQVSRFAASLPRPHRLHEVQKFLEDSSAPPEVQVPAQRQQHQYTKEPPRKRLQRPGWQLLNPFEPVSSSESQPPMLTVTQQLHQLQQEELREKLLHVFQAWATVLRRTCLDMDTEDEEEKKEEEAEEAEEEMEAGEEEGKLALAREPARMMGAWLEEVEDGDEEEQYEYYEEFYEEEEEEEEMVPDAECPDFEVEDDYYEEAAKDWAPRGQLETCASADHFQMLSIEGKVAEPTLEGGDRVSPPPRSFGAPRELFQQLELTQPKQAGRLSATAQAELALQMQQLAFWAQESFTLRLRLSFFAWSTTLWSAPARDCQLEAAESTCRLFLRRASRLRLQALFAFWASVAQKHPRVDEELPLREVGEYLRSSYAKRASELQAKSEDSAYYLSLRPTTIRRALRRSEAALQFQDRHHERRYFFAAWRMATARGAHERQVRWLGRREGGEAATAAVEAATAAVAAVAAVAH